MAAFKPVEGAERFVLRTNDLGVLDVREFSGRIFVFTEADIDPERRDAIRLLAGTQWPDREILMGEKRARLTTGVHFRGPVQEAAGDDDPEAPPSPPPRKARAS